MGRAIGVYQTDAVTYYEVTLPAYMVDGPNAEWVPIGGGPYPPLPIGFRMRYYTITNADRSRRRLYPWQFPYTQTDLPAGHTIPVATNVGTIEIWYVVGKYNESYQPRKYRKYRRRY